MSVVTFEIQNTCEQEIHIKVQNNDRSEENKINHQRCKTLVNTHKNNLLYQSNSSHSPFFEAIRKTQKQSTMLNFSQASQISSIISTVNQASPTQEKPNSRKNTVHLQSQISCEQSSSGRNSPNVILLKQKIESYSYQKRKITNYYSEIKICVYREYGRFKVHQWNIDFDRLYCQNNYFINQTGINVKKQFDSCIISLTIEKSGQLVQNLAKQEELAKNMSKFGKLNHQQNLSKTMAQFYHGKATQMAEEFLKNIFKQAIVVFNQEQQRINHQKKLQKEKKSFSRNYQSKCSFLKANPLANIHILQRESLRQGIHPKHKKSFFGEAKNFRESLLNEKENRDRNRNRNARKSQCPYKDKGHEKRNSQFSSNQIFQSLKSLTGAASNESEVKTSRSSVKKSTLTQRSHQTSCKSIQNLKGKQRRKQRKQSRFKTLKMEYQDESQQIDARKNNKIKAKIYLQVNKDNQSSASQQNLQQSLNEFTSQQNKGKIKSRQWDNGFQIELSIADFNRSRVQKYNQLENLCLFYNSMHGNVNCTMPIDKKSQGKQNTLLSSLYRSQMLKHQTMHNFDKSYMTADQRCQDLITRIFPPASCLPYKKDCFRI